MFSKMRFIIVTYEIGVKNKEKKITKMKKKIEPVF